MEDWSLREFRNDLSIFIDLIKDHSITGNFEALTTVLDEIDSKDLIEYKFENLCFYVKGPVNGSKPTEMAYFKIYLDNMLMAKEELSHDIDPLFGYYLDINIHGYRSESALDKVYCSSWHLDRHKNEGRPRYTHPTYHLQFGGKKMELIDEELSVLSSPRIPHPPMDIFLAFHFILTNFFNNRNFSFVDSITSDIVYQQIVGRAQKRLWTPYFGAYDPNNTHKDFTKINVFPLYVDN